MVSKVFHITIGDIYNKNKSNGVLHAVKSLYERQKEIIDVDYLSIVKRNFDIEHRFKFNLSLMVKLIKLAKKNNIIFHLHGGYNYQFHIISALFYIFNVRYVVSPHGSFTKNKVSNFKGIKKLYLDFVIRFYLSHAYKIQLFGDCDSYYIKKKSLSSKIVFIPNGIENCIKDNISEKYIEYLNFGFCGRINRSEKSIDLIIDGYSNYSKKNKSKKCLLHIIGDGEDLAWAKKRVKDLFLDEEVVFYGSLYGEKKHEVLNCIEVFIHPSRTEGMPLSPLEALSYGSKLVLSNETNLRRYLDGIDGVEFIDLLTSDSVSNSIDRVIKSELDINKAYYILDNALSWPSIAKKMNEIYNDS